MELSGTLLASEGINTLKLYLTDLISSTNNQSLEIVKNFAYSILEISQYVKNFDLFSIFPHFKKHLTICQLIVKAIATPQI
jgi:hypothetical protein